MNYAIVDANNLVTNVILWDGEPSWKPPADCIDRAACGFPGSRGRIARVR